NYHKSLGNSKKQFWVDLTQRVNEIANSNFSVVEYDNLKLLRSEDDREKKGKLAFQYYELFNTCFWDPPHDEYDNKF
ncbi:13616_t:CDS:2, partial [Funneliformis mosseae]